MEEEAKGTDFLVRKFIVIPGIEFLGENLLGLWVIGGIVAFRETKPSIIFFFLFIEFQIGENPNGLILKRKCGLSIVGEI
jgi:hypothetical protein